MCKEKQFVHMVWSMCSSNQKKIGTQALYQSRITMQKYFLAKGNRMGRSCCWDLVDHFSYHYIRKLAQSNFCKRKFLRDLIFVQQSLCKSKYACLESCFCTVSGLQNLQYSCIHVPSNWCVCSIRPSVFIIGKTQETVTWFLPDKFSVIMQIVV